MYKAMSCIVGFDSWISMSWTASRMHVSCMATHNEWHERNTLVRNESIVSHRRISIACDNSIVQVIIRNSCIVCRMIRIPSMQDTIRSIQRSAILFVAAIVRYVRRHAIHTIVNHACCMTAVMNWPVYSATPIRASVARE